MARKVSLNAPSHLLIVSVHSVITSSSLPDTNEVNAYMFRNMARKVHLTQPRHRTGSKHTIHIPNSHQGPSSHTLNMNQDLNIQQDMQMTPQMSSTWGTERELVANAPPLANSICTSVITSSLPDERQRGGVSRDAPSLANSICTSVITSSLPERGGVSRDAPSPATSICPSFVITSSLPRTRGTSGAIGGPSGTGLRGATPPTCRCIPSVGGGQVSTCWTWWYGGTVYRSRGPFDEDKEQEKQEQCPRVHFWSSPNNSITPEWESKSSQVKSKSLGDQFGSKSLSQSHWL